MTADLAFYISDGRIFLRSLINLGSFGGAGAIGLTTPVNAGAGKDENKSENWEV
jgi:hypothetical protein